MQLIQAKVIFPPGRRFPSHYGGDRQNIKVQFPDGSERCIWFNAGEFSHLRKGQNISVLMDGDRLKIVEETTTPAPPPAPTPTQPKVTGTNFREAVSLYSEIFSYCLGKVKADFSTESESSQVAIATSLFQQTVSKYGI